MTSLMEKENLENVKNFYYIFLIGAFASFIAWFVFSAFWNQRYYNKKDTFATPGGATAPFFAATLEDVAGGKSFTIGEQFTLSYQAVVISLLLYYAMRFHN